MAQDHLENLAVLLAQESTAILDEWRKRVRALPVAQSLERPQLDNLVPQLMREIVEAIASQRTDAIARAQLHTPPAHARERLHAGFDLVEIVFEYAALRDGLHDQAEARGLVLAGESRKLIDGVIDGALAEAVREYGLQRAAQAQERRSEYLSFVTHDLKTPLSAIANAATTLGVMCEATGQTDDLEAMIDNILRNVKRLHVLIGSILDEEENVTTATLAVDKRDVLLRPLVDQVLETLCTLSDKAKTAVVNEVPPTLVVPADGDLLRRVFENLLSNAFRHAHSTVVVVGADTIAGGDTASCWVRDQGTGVPAEHIGNLLREKGRGKGSPSGGLGIAIAKRIVVAHGGRLTIQCEHDEGVTFAFTLPLASPQV